MHELGITQEVVALVSERVGEARVLRVVLEVGKLSGVLADAIRFCFDVCAEDTPLEGATLEIIETPGQARCRACGAEFPLDEPFGQCACGEWDLEWLAGHELKINKVEIA